MSQEKIKIMITGAGGFIFSNFLRSALYEKQPYHFIAVDKISSSIGLNNIYSNKNITNYIADITDKHILGRIVELEKPDIIIHAAALTSVDDAFVSPSEYTHNNVMGTQIVCEVAAKFKINRLIYISTDEVYGQLISEIDQSWTEEAQLSPRNLYSATKASGEHIVRSYGNSHGLNYNIIRMSNNYGSRQTVNKFIPRAVKSLLKNEKIKIYGQGQEIRDWLHTADSYSGVMTVIEKGLSGETYNIGANQEFSNIETAQLICKAMSKELSIEFVENRVSHDFRYSVCSDKIKKLGWSPKIRFKDGIQNTVEWYVLNQYWFN